MNFHCELILAALVVAVISMDISKTKIFKPLRESVKDVPFLGQMIICPWCLGHWVALAASIVLWANPLWMFVVMGLAVVPMLLITLLFYVLDRLF